MIRRARASDVPGILAIEEEAFRTDRLTRRKLAHLLARGHVDLLVDSVRGEILGYALLLYRRGSDLARLYGIAVHARERRNGRGRRLLLAAEKAARRAGCRRLGLEVAESNASARALYESSGYRLVSSLPGYYEDGSPAVRCVKELGAP